MIYFDFINSEKNKCVALSDGIFNRNRNYYKISRSDQEAYLNIVISLKMLLNLTNNEIKNNLIFDGDKDGAIDALFIDKKNESIHIFDVKKGNKFERNDVINIFLSEFKRNFLNSKTNLNSLNNLAKLRINCARNLYFKQKYKVIIHFVRIGFLGDSQEICQKYKKNIDKEFANCSNLTYEFIGQNELVENYLRKMRSTINCRISFDENDVFYDKANNVATGKIKIKDIIEIVNKSEQNISYNIFDDNIRIDQINKNLDSDLTKTLQDNGERFFLFHNGITISSQEMFSANGKVFELVNPQILNGCQSIKSLQRIYKKNKKIIDNKFILCRLFKGKNSEDINAVCQSTNSQRPIYTWDLRTNDLIQKVLESLLLQSGYSYNRKNSKKRGNRKIIITDLAQWIESCLNKKPANAKSNKKGLFDISDGFNSDYFRSIFSINHKIDDIIKVCSVCMFVKDKLFEIKKSYKRKQDKSFLDHANMHIMAHVFNYGNEDSKSVSIAINACKKAATKMRVEYGSDYSNNNIFKNPKTWLKYL